MLVYIAGIPIQKKGFSAHQPLSFDLMFSHQFSREPESKSQSSNLQTTNEILLEAGSKIFFPVLVQWNIHYSRNAQNILKLRKMPKIVADRLM